MMILTVWIILIITSQQLTLSRGITVNNHGKVINVNNNGTNSTECCVKGHCLCGCLFTAFRNIENSTIINITSESITLENVTKVGTTISLNNITIISKNATVRCNNIGSVSIAEAKDVNIKGITWDQCGNPNESSVVDGGITLISVTNLTIDNCVFQNSQICAVNLHKASSNITIRNSSYISNSLSEMPNYAHGGLSLDVVGQTSIAISDSVFSHNGESPNDSTYGLFIESSDNKANISLIISRTNFLSNSGGMYLSTITNTFTNITLSELVIMDNANEGINIKQLSIAKGSICITLLHSILSNNGNGGIVNNIFVQDRNAEIKFTVESSNFTDNRGIDFYNTALTIKTSLPDSPVSPINNYMYIQNSNFINNSNGTIYISTSKSTGLHLVYFYKVVVKDCVTVGSSSGSGTISISLQSTFNNTYDFHSVNFTSNDYLGITGGAVFLKTANAENDIFVENSVFESNNGLGRGAAFYVADGVLSNSMVYDTRVYFTGVNFTNNRAPGNSIIYIAGGTINTTRVTVKFTYFINNTGTALHMFMSMVTFFTCVLFENNTANSGAALYLEQGTQVYFDDKYGSANVQFVNNTANQYGGAIYSDLPSTCRTNGVVFHSQNTWNFIVSFMNNKAGLIGNSLYFNIQESCKVDSNVNSTNSLLYLPYKFNYSEAYNTSIVTSPNLLVLYSPNHDGSYIDKETFFISNKILGEAITFTGAVFDYVNNSAEPTQFHVKCLINCSNFNLADDRLLVDNVSVLNITISGHKIDLNPINVTYGLTSILASSNKQISMQLKIELLPCFSGYFYDTRYNTCVCYNHKDIVECYGDYSEIKRGYWFGTLTNSSKPTVSLCPNRYCDFGKQRKETRQGYCIIPHRSDDQCNSHRTGVACGECKQGYTLAYDSPDCINVDECSAGMTILVIVLTILYWIVIVAVVFSLMYFQSQMSLGYVYGIIYYYSIVDILLDNNPYISDAVFQVVAILSSFANLTPQLFGQFCLVAGLSGIDQQFIHYSHALAISLILLIIVLVTRYSPRFALFVRRSIIRVICLLLLLSYTSLASTSLQLLRPASYPGYNGLYVYLSPGMKYFNNRHALYGVVAILCEVIVVIGLPLFLLLEPLILSRYFNFIKIKPLLDQFQGCYKDKYRWFAAYYLICRQVIILIMYFGNSDYYEMLYYLQTACVIIAMLHIWTQPYIDDFLNALDGIVLLTLILIININTFTFLSSATSPIIIILILFPLFVFCLIGSKKLISHYILKRKQQYALIDNINYVDDDINMNMNYERYVMYSSTAFVIFAKLL